MGTWHSAYSQCSAACALGLGWNGLGKQHWSCCFSLEESSVCRKTKHLYECTPVLAGEVSEKLALGTKSDCPRYQINLDDDPKNRWTQIIEAHREQLGMVLEIIEDIIGTGFTASVASQVFNGLTKAGRFYYGAEIEGIAAAAKLPVGKVALIQIAYEVFAACTSIVADVDGEHLGLEAGSKTPFHIRTMDWPMPGLEKMTIEVDYVSQGRVLYSATTWPGYVGVLTGLRPQAYSVSVNYRRTQRGADDMFKAVVHNMLQGLAQSWPVSFLVRECLESVETYEGAIGALQQSDLMAPTYITVAGTEAGQGVVITRSRKPSQALPLWNLAEHGPIAQSNHDWFLGNAEVAQALGGDMGTTDNICHSHEREAVVRKAIESLGNVVSPVDLWLLLSTEPCRAEDTVYTVAMHPATGLLLTRSRVLPTHEQEGFARWGKLVRKEMRALRARTRAAGTAYT